MPANDLRSRISSETRAAFQPVLRALPKVRAILAENREVVMVRAGYEYPPEGAPIPAVVIAMFPEAASAVDAGELRQKVGVPVSVIQASVEEQLASIEKAEGPVAFALTTTEPASALESLMMEEALPPEFRPPKTGTYVPMDPPDLPELNEEMEVTICVSPEAGWTPLKKFLEGTERRLIVAMYQFTAPHIFETLRAAVAPAGRELELVLHPVPEPPAKSGVKEHDLDEKSEVLTPLHNALAGRFQFSWATLRTNTRPDGLWASAYHIKVAVRDSACVWLSSGNWQSSNQPDIDPFADPDDVPAGFQRKYNRDYHAIIQNDRLAEIFEKYIHRDHMLTAAQAGDEVAFAMPDVFVPIEEEEEEPVAFAAVPQYFKPLPLKRVVRVQPLLTPDNYPTFTLQLIREAKTSVWFQNQYINFRDDGEDLPEFQELVGALKDQIDAGLDVRIICRDMMKEASLDVLVAMGFPREKIRFQKACHNKTIIVDGEKVLFGSQNWSNEGVKPNRDASLLFYDSEIAAYLAKVYKYDWERLANGKPVASRPRVAREGEAAPAGMRRVPLTDIVED